MGFLWTILATQKSDRDLLIELSTKVELIHTLLTNHLEHHFAYNMALLGALLSLVVGVILYAAKSGKVKAVINAAVTEKEGE